MVVGSPMSPRLIMIFLSSERHKLRDDAPPGTSSSSGAAGRRMDGSDGWTEAAHPLSRPSVTPSSSLSTSAMTLCRHEGASVRSYVHSAIRAQPRCWVHVTGGVADAPATPAGRKKDLWLWRENVYHAVNERRIDLDVQTVACRR